MADWTPPESDLVKVKDEFLNGLARLETAGGKKTIKGPNGEDSNNLFNIKDNTGQGYRAKDKAEGSNDAYRVYASTDHAKDDLTNLLARRYPDAISAQTPEEFASALKRGGYATDPNYVQKLTATIKGASKMWSPPDADKMEESSWSPPAGDAMDAKPKEEPGWFQPGSKSATIVNNLAQGATFGFGDEIAAGVRSLTGGDTYANELKDLRGRADVNNKANPTTAVVSNVIGSMPSYAAAGAGKLAAQMGKTALVSGIQSAGASDGDLADRATQGAIGAATGAAVVPVLKGLGAVGGKVVNSVTKTNPDGSVSLKLGSTGGLKALADKVFNEGGVMDRGAGAAIGGYYGGLPGAGLGAITGVRKVIDRLPIAGAVKDVASEAIAVPRALGVKIPTTGVARPIQEALKTQHISNQGTALTAGVTSAISGRTAALTQMSRGEVKQEIQKGNTEVEQSVANGKPEYAAQFQALQNPNYREAVRIDSNENDPDEDKDEDDEE